MRLFLICSSPAAGQDPSQFSKTATVTVVTPPQSFCLFSVPATFKTGQVKGLSTPTLALPAIGTAK